MEKNVFILHTLHHINLSISIIKDQNLSNNILILFDSFKINDNKIEYLYKYFYKIEIFDKFSNERFEKKYSIIEWKNKFKFNYQQIKDFDKMLIYLKEFKYKKMFFANNTGVEVQILLDILKDNTIEINYIEDGSAAYHDINIIEKYFRIKKILKPNYLVYCIKYKYLKKFKMNSVIGLGEYVDCGYYTCTNYIREELKRIKANKINLLEYKKALMECSETINIVNSIILIMELSDNKKTKEMIKMINILKKSKYDIYIKYHPREHKFYADNLLNDKIKKLDSNLNIENILIGSENNIVIGSGMSTAFLLLPLISKNRFISVNKFLEINYNERYIEIIKKNGCVEISNINDLNKYVLE